MDKKFDVAALGELLMDLTECGVSPRGNMVFEANPGGAPCNVLAMLQKLGRRTAFIGKVGEDMFGAKLRAEAESLGIDTGGLLTDGEARTTLAFVRGLPGGDRDFSFYRNPGADMRLRAGEVPEDIIKDAKIFHFGTLSMTHAGVRKATKRAVETAKAAGAIISFDPNLRLPLWGSPDNAREQINWGLSRADVVKIADNELEFVTGERDIAAGADILRGRHRGVKLLSVTAGAGGSHAFFEGEHVYVPAFELGGTVDTTGAGDTFCACVLDFIIRHGISELTGPLLTDMLRFSNAAAYLVTTQKGAIRSMPEPERVYEILDKHPGDERE